MSTTVVGVIVTVGKGFEGVNRMNQYCRYCANALDYNGEATDFICEADAPCGGDGAGIMYPASKAKRINKCRYFVFNELDIFGQLEDGSFKKYHPQGKREKVESKQIGIFDKAGEIK